MYKLPYLFSAVKIWRRFLVYKVCKYLKENKTETTEGIIYIFSITPLQKINYRMQAHICSQNYILVYLFITKLFLKIKQFLKFDHHKQ